MTSSSTQSEFYSSDSYVCKFDGIAPQTEQIHEQARRLHHRCVNHAQVKDLAVLILLLSRGRHFDSVVNRGLITGSKPDHLL